MTVSSQPDDLLFDHVGILVSDLDQGKNHLSSLLGKLSWTKRFDDAGLGVSVRFARDIAGLVYELISPLGDKSPVARALSSRTDSLNQIAYRTPALEPTLARLRAEGFVPLGKPKPAVAFGGARVQFMMTPLNFVIELVEVDRVVHSFSEF